MSWAVLDHPDFADERTELPEEVQDKLAEVVKALEHAGPQLGRPLVDTLNGSDYANMKEIRFKVEGEWRFAFAFDEDRQAIILVGGSKEGVAAKKFYKQLIHTADKRFLEWLEAED